jgi:hypothetical protein
LNAVTDGFACPSAGFSDEPTVLIRWLTNPLAKLTLQDSQEIQQYDRVDVPKDSCVCAREDSPCLLVRGWIIDPQPAKGIARSAPTEVVPQTMFLSIRIMRMAFS